MRVGMFLIGNDEGYRYLGSLAAQVCKHTMPGVEVCHFTDMDSLEIPGVDTVICREKTVPMAVFRMQHHQVEGDWLFIDVDCLVVKDVQHVFDGEFDIAIASRVQNDGTQGKRWEEMPHNMGVVFSRSPEFWKAVEKDLLTYEPKMQEWMGDQLAVCRLIMKNQFDTLIIPGETYNFPPSSAEMNDAAIRHYKGRRKPLMVANAKGILNEVHL